jgi:PAS domain S-box-containing protein
MFPLWSNKVGDQFEHAPFSTGDALKIFLLAVIYFITAKYGLSLNSVSGFATLVWAPSGIAVAALFLFGYRLWPGILLAAFAVNYFVQDAPLITALAIATGNTLETIVAIYLLKRLTQFNGTFGRLDGVFGFIILGALISTMISASVGVASLILSDLITADLIRQTWLSWWIGDALGMLVVTPLLLSTYFTAPVYRKISSVRLWEMLCLVSLLFVICGFVFFGVSGELDSNGPLVFLIFPLLIWAAVRFNIPGAAMTTFIVAVITIWGTYLGNGPFVHGTLSHNLLILQIFIGAAAITALMLSAAMNERRIALLEIRSKQNENQALLESIADGVIATDLTGHIILCNNAAKIMLQVTNEHVLGQRYDRVLNENNSMIEPLRDPLKAALSAGKTFRNTVTDPAYYFLRKDGTRFPIALTVSPVHLEGKIVGVINVFRDLSTDKNITV